MLLHLFPPFENSVKLLQKNLSFSLPTFAQLWQNFHLLHISTLLLPFILQTASSVIWAYCIFPPIIFRSLCGLYTWRNLFHALKKDLLCIICLLNMASGVVTRFQKMIHQSSISVFRNLGPLLLIFFLRCGNKL